MASPGLVKALEGFDRLKTSIRNKAITARVREERAYGAGTAVIAAALAGAADAKYRADDGTAKKLVGPIPMVGGIAAILAIGGLTEYVPGSHYVGMAGVGALSYVIGKYSHDKTVEHMQAAK
jgi:hypothetical protein